MRGLLKAQGDWARTQPRSETQIEMFRHIAFWRVVLKDAELRLNFGDLGEVEAGTVREIGQ